MLPCADGGLERKHDAHFDFAIAPGLEDVVSDIEFFGSVTVGRSSTDADYYDRRGHHKRVFANFREDLQPAQIRHLDIEEHKVGPLLQDRLQR